MRPASDQVVRTQPFRLALINCCIPSVLLCCFWLFQVISVVFHIFQFSNYWNSLKELFIFLSCLWNSNCWWLEVALSVDFIIWVVLWVYHDSRHHIDKKWFYSLKYLVIVHLSVQSAWIGLLKPICWSGYYILNVTFCLPTSLREHKCQERLHLEEQWLCALWILFPCIYNCIYLHQNI